MLSGVVLGAAALGAAYLGGPLLAILVSLAGALGWLEWLRLAGPPAGGAARALGPVGLVGLAGLGGALIASVLWMPGPALAIAAGASLLVALIARGATRRRALAGSGVVLFAAVVIATLWLRGDDSLGRATIFWLFGIVWGTDIGAYAFGKLIGGPKLAPTVSPGKTWAGALGGLTAGIGASVLLGALLPLAGWVPARPPVATLAILGGLGSIVCQLGDLAESALKRRAGVKDSGRLIPGHGGLLDRIDGYVLAALALAALTLAAGAGAAPPWSMGSP